MENNKNKKLWLGLVIVLVVLVGLLFWSMKKNAVPGVGQNKNLYSPESTEDTSAGSINEGAGAVISYASALSKYKGAILELDGSCKANSGNITLKNNTYLMIDNQAPIDRVIKVGSITNIKANSFKLVQIESESAPATLSVDCDQSQNVATVFLQ